MEKTKSCNTEWKDTRQNLKMEHAVIEGTATLLSVSTKGSSCCSDKEISNILINDQYTRMRKRVCQVELWFKFLSHHLEGEWLNKIDTRNAESKKGVIWAIIWSRVKEDKSESEGIQVEQC